MKTLKNNVPRLFITMILLFYFFPALTAQDFAVTKSYELTSSNMFSIDTAFVGKNMRDNKMEIDLSEMALKKSKNQKVKKLARLMVTDHTQILNNLAKIAQNNAMLAIPGYPTDGSGGNGTASYANKSTVVAKASSSKGTQVTSPVNNSNKNIGSTNNGSYNNLGTTGTTTAATVAGRGKGINAGNQKPISANGKDNRMKMQAIDAMQTSSGAAFDKLWIPQMLTMHEAKLSELSAVVDTINDSDLKTAVKSAIPKIKMHRDMLLAMNNSKSRK